jgi:hypothetical protein
LVALLPLLAGCGSDPAFAPSSDEQVGTAMQQLGPPQWSKEHKVTPPEPTMACDFCYFGVSVGLRGSTAVVGTSPSAVTVSNAAYVYARNGNDWDYQQALLGSDVVAGDEFGAVVAVDGDTIVSTAQNQTGGRGAVYVFTRTGTTWTQQQKIVSPKPAANQYFGYEAALSGNTLLVCDYSNTPGKSRGYVYVRSGTAWTLQQQITAPSPTVELFGISADVRGNTLIMGSFGSNAFVYVRSGTTWTLQQELLSSDGAGAGYGTGVALDGDTALVTAHNRAPAGAAYVFTRTGTSWTQQQKLVGSDGVAPAALTASLSGDTAIFNSSGYSANGGQAYIFRRTAGVWQETQKLLNPDQVPDSRFAASSAIDGDRAILGAYGENNVRGAAYVFRQSTGSGGACSANEQCNPGEVCGSEGVCCDSVCGEPCESCLASAKGSGEDGVCGPVAANRDDRDDCDADDANSCGLTGYCDGAGACALQHPGTVCAPVSCSSATSQQPAKTCDGSGACVVSSAITCQPGYLCLENGCKTSCTADSDCDSQAGYACLDGACNKAPNGSACNADMACASGSCALEDGVCCDAACDGACEACVGEKTGGADGVCAFVTTETDPDDECEPGEEVCGAPGACDGAGACQSFAASGTTCAETVCVDGAQSDAQCDGAGVCQTSTGECDTTTPDDEPVTPDDEPVTPDDEPVTPDDEPATPDDEPVTPDDEPATASADDISSGCAYHASSDRGLTPPAQLAFLVAVGLMLGRRRRARGDVDAS